MTAIDLTTNMICIAQEKANEINDPRVRVYLCQFYFVTPHAGSEAEKVDLLCFLAGGRK